MDKKVRFTILQLAEALKTSRDAAYGLIQFLKAKELVAVVDSVRKEGARGKGQDVYEADITSLKVLFDDALVNINLLVN